MTRPAHRVLPGGICGCALGAASCMEHPLRPLPMVAVRRPLLLCLLAATGLGFGISLPSAHAQSVSTAARNIYQAHQDALAVVTARCEIVFTTDEGSLPNQELPVQTLGTLVHPKGLVMISNSALDLSIGMVGQRGRVAGSEQFVTVTKAEGTFPEIQINLSDGSEYNATRIHHNAELDVAFLLLNAKQVAERKVPLTFVDLSQRISEGGISIADDVVGLSRSSAVYNHIPTVLPGHVTAISKKPEATWYVTTAGISEGTPVFDTKGRFVGLTVQRVAGGQRTNVRGTLAAGTVAALMDLAKAKAGLP